MSSAIRAGKAEILLAIRDQTRRGLNSAQRSLARWASSVGRIGLGLTTTGAALAGLFVPAIREAGKLQQLEGRFESVFRGIVDSAERTAEELAGKLNLTPSLVKGDLATFQSFFAGIGLDAAEALQQSFRSVNIVQDLVAQDETASRQELLDRLLSTLSGEAEAARRLRIGVDVRKTSQQYTTALAEVEKANAGLSETAKTAVANLNQVEDAMNRTGIAGQALREVNTITARQEQVLAQLSATWASFGQAVGPVVASLGGGLVDLLRSAEDFARNNPRLIQGAALGVPVLLGFGTAATVAAGGLLTLSVGIGALTGFGAVSLAVPAAGIVALGAAAFAAVQNLDLLKSTGISAANSLKQSLGDVPKIANDAVGGLSDALAANDLQLAAKIGLLGIELAFKETFGDLQESYQSLVDTIAKGLLKLQPRKDFFDIITNPRLLLLARSGRGRILLFDNEQAKQVIDAIDEEAEKRRSNAERRKKELSDELKAAREIAEERAEAARAAFAVPQPPRPDPTPQVRQVEQQAERRSLGTFGGLADSRPFAPIRDGLKLIAKEAGKSNELLADILDELEESPPLRVPA